jgi:hypothetical protein
MSSNNIPSRTQSGCFEVEVSFAQLAYPVMISGYVIMARYSGDGIPKGGATAEDEL